LDTVNVMFAVAFDPRESVAVTTYELVAMATVGMPERMPEFVSNCRPPAGVGLML
jgi:hypothetical protein